MNSIRNIAGREWSKIKIVDAQIDRLVYGLYGLTDEEIEVVEDE